MRPSVYGLLMWLGPVLGAPVVSDPVANACSPLCAEETQLEIQCAKDKGCYRPMIKANPVIFEDCWKNCSLLAGQCFSLCADNFDSILGQCYTGCKPSLDVDCIAGCFDLSFITLKHTSLNETDNFTGVISANSTNESTDPAMLSPFTTGQDLPGATSNVTSHKAVVLKLVGVSGPWLVYQEVTPQDDHTDQPNNSSSVSDPTKTRSRPSSDRIQVLGLNELKGFYRGADGLLRKRIEHTYDRELWKLLIAQYEHRFGIDSEHSAENPGSNQAGDVVDDNTDALMSLENISLPYNGMVFLVKRNK